MPTTWNWFTFWLILHILTVIIAFGPTFAFGLIGAQIAKSPQNAHFGAHLIDMIEGKMTIPLALTLPISGIGLIVTSGLVFFQSKWLLISLVLFVFALLYAILVQLPTSRKLLGALSKMPPGPPPEGATGPPPEVAALTKRLQMGGILLTALVVVIVVLMIWRPGACVVSC